MKNRHDPIVTQLTNLMMRDGKKAKAENDMATVLSILRTNPAPTYDPRRQLLPGAPPASHLPLNPVLYLTLAIDSVAPLLRIRSQRGAAGGGQALQIPVPLGVRQRRRQAFTWILDAASKKGDRLRFPERVAQEIISVVEGRSGLWERRAAVHKLGTAARTSLGWGGKGGFRR
jgi:small subunit ribosomal protein S7